MRVEKDAITCAANRGPTSGPITGQRDLAVTANTYSHVMLSQAEVHYADLLA